MVNYIKEKIVLRKVKMNNEWQKHDGSEKCPVSPYEMIEVETWASSDFKALAGNLEWKYVKFYRVIPEKK